MRTTEIEWTEHTWNPFVGCSVHSAGCKNCYAMRMAARLDAAGQSAYRGTTKNGAWSGVLHRNSERVRAKPRRIAGEAMIFVNSMSDFWHASAEDAWRIEALATMRACPQHVFQVLTKRPENIRPFLARTGETIPPNVWLGATVEDGRVTDRIGAIRGIAPINFLSIEPLIGPIYRIDLTGIQWVIVGGESGPRCRPMHPDWVREVRDQCAAQGVPFFFKQWGHLRNNPMPDGDTIGKGGSMLDGRHHKAFPLRIAAE